MFDFINMITIPEILYLLILLRTIIKLERYYYQNSSFEKTAASVIRELNALGKIPVQVQKLLRQPLANVPQMVAEYKRLSPLEQLDLTKKCAPLYFSPTIRKGNTIKTNPNYRTNAFSAEEYEKFLYQNRLPTVLQMVEGLERGTANIIRKNGFIPLESETQASSDKAIEIGAKLFGDKQSFFNITNHGLRTYDVPNKNIQQEVQKLLSPYSNLLNVPNQYIDNAIQHIYLGNQPGSTFIKAPIRDLLSNESCNDYSKILKDEVKKALKKWMRDFVKPDWGSPQDEAELMKFLELDNIHNITYEGVSLWRIISAVISRHEVMEALEKKRSILKNKKGRLFSPGIPGDIDNTSHFSPNVIADEILNLNSIFGHPANSPLFRIIRSMENVNSPSYKEMGFNYFNPDLPSIDGSSRKDIIRKSRNYSDKEILPYSSIASYKIDDFIDGKVTSHLYNKSEPLELYLRKNNLKLVKNLNEDYNQKKSDIYCQNHKSFGSQFNDNGDSILRSILSKI